MIVPIIGFFIFKNISNVAFLESLARFLSFLFTLIFIINLNKANLHNYSLFVIIQILLLHLTFLFIFNEIGYLIFTV